MVLWEKERQKLWELEQDYRARARTLAAPNQPTYLYTSGLVRAQCQVERGRQQGKHSVCKLEGRDRLVSALSVDIRGGWVQYSTSSGYCILQNHPVLNTSG